jgi:hypothetical protein
MTITTKATPRRCPKCQHVNQQSTMDIHEACPSCGAIYSRVEAYLRAEKERAGPPSRSVIASTLPKSQNVRSTARLVDPDFVSNMRSESLYPTFRALVKLGTWFFYLIAVIAVVIAFANDSSGSLKIGALLGSLAFVIFITAAKEASLMLADMSDATVIRAAQWPTDGQAAPVSGE